MDQALVTSTALALRSALVAEIASWNGFVTAKDRGLPSLFNAALLPLFLGDADKLREYQSLILGWNPPPIFAEIKGCYFNPPGYVQNLYGAPLINTASDLLALQTTSTANFNWTYP
ncbi:MAG: hypothetical protein JWR26_4843 [Pedosphaera sp.]|nr:hypothetical protein [Pedosphaera sp.]